MYLVLNKVTKGEGMKNIQIFSILAIIALLHVTEIYAVTIDGKNWRQLTETTNISFDELTEIYDINTGELLDPTNYTIGGVSFAGWTWADPGEVSAMFNTFTGLNIAEEEWYFEFDSTWAPEFFTKFDPLHENSTETSLMGITRSKKVINNNILMGLASIDDFIQGHSLGDAALNIHIWKNGTNPDYTGAFLYNLDAASIPEPATFALLGIGLVGLAGVEVRRRRKKKAVMKR